MSTHDTAPVPDQSTAPAGTTLTGHVRSALRPLPEITLTMTDRAGTQIARARSGADGQFRFTDLRPGTYVLIASGKGYQPHAQMVVLDATPTVPLTVTLDPATSVHGVVHDRHSGQPVAAAAVTAFDPSGEVIASTVSDPDGSYRITGIHASEITLVAAAAAADPTTSVIQLDADDTGPHHAADLALDTHSTLTGTITAGGRPVARLRLTLRDHHGRTAGAAITDDNGMYRFGHVKAGTYTLHAPANAPQATAISPETTTADVVLSPPR